MQDKNRDADVENGLGDPAGEGEGGTSWESSTDTYTTVCEAASGKQLYNTRNSALCSLTT